MRTSHFVSRTTVSALALALALGVFAPAFAANGKAETPDAQGAGVGGAGVWGAFLAGMHAEAIGQGRKALDFYGAAAGRGLPAGADLYSRMYILALTEGRLKDALAALDETEKLGGQGPLASLTRAVAAFKAGQFAEAEKFMQGDEAGVSRLLGPVLSAWARAGQKDFQGAIAKLGEAEDGKALSSPLQQLHGGMIQELAGNTAEASALFAKLRQGEGGPSVRSAELMGQFYERRGQADEARAVYQSFAADAEGDMFLEAQAARAKSGKRPPIDVDTAAKGAAEALYGVASALLSQGAWESALALAHLADDLRPGFTPAAMVAAGALEQTRRLEEAAALYAKVPDAAPLSWMARLRLADVLDALKQTDKAEALLRAMARERPTQARPLIALGDLLRGHERFQDAADAYSQALKRVGALQEGHWAVFYSRGIAYEQTKQWDKAEPDFLKALELSPEQPLALNYLGYSWIDQGQNLERALGMIQKAVDLRPRDGYIVDSLGWGLYRTGDFEGAVKQLERAVMLRPADAVINDHLGDALWQVGRAREARFQWERALDMKPDAELAQALESKLRDGLAAAKP